MITVLGFSIFTNMGQIEKIEQDTRLNRPFGDPNMFIGLSEFYLHTCHFQNLILTFAW